jgi:hypothetical protein
MTVKTDAAALMPNATAKAAVVSKGADYASLNLLLQQHAVDMIALVKQLISLHPTSGDSSTLTALNNLLTELL